MPFCPGRAVRSAGLHHGLHPGCPLEPLWFCSMGCTRVQVLTAHLCAVWSQTATSVPKTLLPHPDADHGCCEDDWDAARALGRVSPDATPRCLISLARRGAESLFSVARMSSGLWFLVCVLLRPGLSENSADSRKAASGIVCWGKTSTEARVLKRRQITSRRLGPGGCSTEFRS